MFIQDSHEKKSLKDSGNSLERKAISGYTTHTRIRSSQRPSGYLAKTIIHASTCHSSDHAQTRIHASAGPSGGPACSGTNTQLESHIIFPLPRARPAPRIWTQPESHSIGSWTRWLDWPQSSNNVHSPVVPHPFSVVLWVYITEWQIFKYTPASAMDSGDGKWGAANGCLLTCKKLIPFGFIVCLHSPPSTHAWPGVGPGLLAFYADS